MIIESRTVLIRSFATGSAQAGPVCLDVSTRGIDVSLKAGLAVQLVADALRLDPDTIRLTPSPVSTQNNRTTFYQIDGLNPESRQAIEFMRHNRIKIDIHSS